MHGHSGAVYRKSGQLVNFKGALRRNTFAVYKYAWVKLGDGTSTRTYQMLAKL